MRLSEDIKPISYVKANSAQVLEQVNSSGPLVITQNGEAAAVLMGVQDYERLTQGIALMKILALSEKNLQENDAVPLADAFAKARAEITKRKANG